MKLKFRKANIEDAQLYFDWANDKTVRENSFNRSEINFEQHVNWFTKKLSSANCFFYLFLNEENDPVGQVRIDITEEETVIGISIDEHYRGKDLGVEMLTQACNDYFKIFPSATIIAYIKEENTPSIKLFTKANFIKIANLKVGDNKSLKFQKTEHERN
jgi:RimJ/RimL family protein N-acetyltransferase